MSKLIAYLEMDTGLTLFDRVKGRLAPTEQAMRLYDEAERIFAGLNQLESAVEVIRREEQRRLSVGVLPALSAYFIQQGTAEFLQTQRNVFCSVQALSSQWIVDWVVARKLDIGIVNEGVVNPYANFEPILDMPMVCILPLGHALSAKAVIGPHDLKEQPFVSYPLDSGIGNRVQSALRAHGVDPQIVLTANWAVTISEFVAAGLGVALIHPLSAHTMKDRLVVRRFEPDISDGFQICRSPDVRNAELIEGFAQELRRTAQEISKTMLDNISANTPATHNH